MDEHLLRCKTSCSGGRQENSPTLNAARQEPSAQQTIGRTDIDMRSLLRTAPSDLAHILRHCRRKLHSGYPVLPPSSEGSLLGPLGFIFIFGGFLFLFVCFFLFLAQLYKQIEIRTSEGSRQQVLLLQLCRTPDSSLSPHAIPARTPLQ